MNGHTETVKVLLDYSADVDARGTSAQRLAAANGHASTVETLLDARADFPAHGKAMLRNGPCIDAVTS
jgi:ankyrin repeat protein